MSLVGAMLGAMLGETDGEKLEDSGLVLRHASPIPPSSPVTLPALGLVVLVDSNFSDCPPYSGESVATPSHFSRTSFLLPPSLLHEGRTGISPGRRLQSS
mmetsp:Transcript_62854/g.130677  ORF Transcript_62854/g.130677 Transcript_62854/m.130677 type:complete len:100 (-) Transcript_62854:15-314(-)